MDSILNSIKKLIGLSEDYTPFDTDLIIHINSTFSQLQQLQVGPEAGYSITDASNTWDEFIPIDDPRFNMVKSYMYIKVRLLFDQSSLTSGSADALNKEADKIEWRLNALAEGVS